MTGGETWLAVLLAVAGSAAFAVAAVTQQVAAARLPAGRAFDPAVLARLVRRPAWLAGLAAVIAGFGLQAAALGLGRLVVIEPVLASGLLFALVLAARRERRRLSRAEWAAALAVVGGLAVFLAVGQPTGGHHTASAGALGLAVAAAAGLTGLCAVLAGRFPGHRRALLFGVAGGVAAGAADAVTKSVAVVAGGHLLAPFTDARLYLLIVVGLLTFTVQQNGYRAAALAAFLPAFAVIEPVSGSLAGLIIYGERLNAGPAQVVVELAASAAAAWGITHLAGRATGPRADRQARQAGGDLGGPAQPAAAGSAPAAAATAVREP